MFSVLPSQPKLQLSNEHIRLSLCFLLCIDTLTYPPDCRACPACGKDAVDDDPANQCAWDDHIACCSRGGQIAIRHNELQTVIISEATRVGQVTALATVVKESPTTLIADILFPNIPGRRGAIAVVTDVTIVNPMAKSNRASAGIPLAAAAAAEATKTAKYSAACHEHRLDFRPIAFETTGALGQSAKDMFAVLLANACKVARDDSVGITDFMKLVQVTAVTIARSIGNKFINAAADSRGHNRPNITRHRRGRGQYQRF